MVLLFKKHKMVYLAAIVLLAFATCKNQKQEANVDLAQTKCTRYQEFIQGRLSSGGIDDRCQRTRTEIKNGISTCIPELKALLKMHPDIEGQILLSFGVNNCGDVDTCFVQATKIKDTQFVNEVIQVVMMIKFEKIEREGVYCLFDYPFNFTQDEAKK